MNERSFIFIRSLYFKIIILIFIMYGLKNFLSVYNLMVSNVFLINCKCFEFKI